jgi:prophage antirepressor-like protein
MTELLQHPEFGQIRSQRINKEYWFCANDVCRVLGLKNSRQALSRHCLKEDLAKIYTEVITGLNKDGTMAKQQVKMNFINESGLCALIFNSEKEKAREFKHWIISEVLPAIRKYGYYSSPHINNAKKHIYIKASKEMFEQARKHLYLSDFKRIAQKARVSEAHVRAVLNSRTEDVHVATMLINHAKGNAELRSLFYEADGALAIVESLRNTQPIKF